MKVLALAVRRVTAILGTLAFLIVLAVTPVSAGDEEDEDEGSGGVPSTAMTAPSVDASAVLYTLGVASIVWAARIGNSRRQSR